MKALVLTNGDYGDYDFCEAIAQYDYVVCADNGMHHARKLQIVPHEIVGDFDSCHESDLAYFREAGTHAVQVPAEKDETDTQLAIEKAIEKGATQIDVYGGVGSRMDHSMANMQLLYKYMKQGVEVVLYNHKNTIRLVQKEVRLQGKAGDLVSLMPFSEEVTGITTRGLAYGLCKGRLALGDAVGVSNYMLTNEAEIELEKGLLLVFQTKD
ncbi:MAG: thiamine diphosphokinase [Cellulosilyticaceae bacterium]